MINQLINRYGTVLVLWLTGLSCITLGASTWAMGDHSHIKAVTGFLGVGDMVSGITAAQIAAVSFIVAGVLAIAALVEKRSIKILGPLLVVMSIPPLVSLLSDARWIDSLGGFPVIGSGQGIIKYFALMAIGATLILGDRMSGRTKQLVNLFPVALVLVWIGGMKFMEFEAEGIKILVETSPLMSWMYSLWDVRMTSNIIGIFDLLAVALLVLSLKYRQCMWPGVLMAGAVFVTTQTFLISLPGALSDATYLSTGGQFVIKDLWFIANLIFFLQATPNTDR